MLKFLKLTKDIVDSHFLPLQEPGFLFHSDTSSRNQGDDAEDVLVDRSRLKDR